MMHQGSKVGKWAQKALPATIFRSHYKFFRKSYKFQNFFRFPPYAIHIYPLQYSHLMRMVAGLFRFGHRPRLNITSIYNRFYPPSFRKARRRTGLSCCPKKPFHNARVEHRRPLEAAFFSSPPPISLLLSSPTFCRLLHQSPADFFTAFLANFLPTPSSVPRRLLYCFLHQLSAGSFIGFPLTSCRLLSPSSPDSFLTLLSENFTMFLYVDIYDAQENKAESK